MKITRVLMVVMMSKQNNVNKGVVAILSMMSLQPSLQQKGTGHLLQILIKEGHHITEIISNPEEPMHPILLLLMPMQDS